MKKTFALWLLVFVVVPCTRAFTLVPDGDQLYKLTDLGALPGGFFSEGFGISSGGQVVGAADCSTCGGFIHAFLWTRSRVCRIWGRYLAVLSARRLVSMAAAK